MFFFFSSRRRHTRCSRDWSSDVCSSDLNLSRSQINDGRGNEKGGNLVRAAVQQLSVLALDDIEPTDAGGNVNADFVEIRILGLPVSRFHGKIRAEIGRASCRERV